MTCCVRKISVTSCVEKIILLDAQNHVSFKASHAIQHEGEVKQQHNRHNKNCKHVLSLSLSLSLSRELFFFLL